MSSGLWAIPPPGSGKTACGSSGPMTGLDIMITKKLIDKMKEYKKEGNSIFLTSHNIDLVGKLCDRVAVVNGGKIMDVVDLQDKSNMEEVEEIFLKLTEVIK